MGGGAVSVFLKRPDSRGQVVRACVCVHVRVYVFFSERHVLCVFSPSLSAGISLLVPHGGITEDTSWEMYMIINQEDSR